MENYIEGWNSLKPIRCFGDMYIPTVFSEELSYYEKLCRVVDELNKTLKNVDLLHDEYVDLNNACETLKGFVDHYFDNLDVQQEINNKLDEMATNGQLSAIVQKIIGNISAPRLVDSIENMTNKALTYVLISTGTFYQWNGTEWEDTGLVYGLTDRALLSSNVTISESNVNNFINPDEYEQNRIYAIVTSAINTGLIQNLPIAQPGILYDMGYNSKTVTGRLQYYISYTGGQKFVRSNFANHWYPWLSWGKAQYIINANDGPGLNFDEFALNNVTYISPSVTEENISNIPAYGQFGVATSDNYNTDFEIAFQTYTNPTNQYVRFFNKNLHTDWHRPSAFKGYIVPSTLKGISANDVEMNTIIHVGTVATESDITDLPQGHIYGSYAYLISLSRYYDNIRPENNHWGSIQFFLGPRGNYYRIRSSGTWLDWLSMGFKSIPAFFSDKNLPYYENLDKMPANNYAYYSSNTIEGLPFNTAMGVFNFSASSSELSQFQFANSFYLGFFATRMNASPYDWTRWNYFSGNNLWLKTLLVENVEINSSTNLLCFGDSIFTKRQDTYTIPQLLGMYTGANVRNFSVGGATISDREDSVNTITNQLNNHIDDIAWSDVVIISAGVNDSTLGIPIETAQTYMRACIDFIRNNNATAKIVWITPYPHQSMGMRGLIAYSSGLCYVATTNDINVIAGIFCPIPIHRAADFTYMPSIAHDGIHPTDQGKKIIARFILNELRVPFAQTVREVNDLNENMQLSEETD